jgi:hypothetical protein
VLDGVPRSFTEASALFTVKDSNTDFGTEEVEDADDGATVDSAVLPTAVILLDGPREELEKRVCERYCCFIAQPALRGLTDALQACCREKCCASSTHWTSC